MEGSVYLKARQEWDEHHADLVLGKRNWQITAAGNRGGAGLRDGLGQHATRSKFVPYVVEVDKLGYAIGAPAADSAGIAAAPRTPASSRPSAGRLQTAALPRASSASQHNRSSHLPIQFHAFHPSALALRLKAISCWNFYSGAISLSGRFTEGFSLRRLQRTRRIE